MAKRRRTKRRFQYIRQRFPKKMQKKLVLVFMLTILAFAILVLRATYINAAEGDKYAKVVLDQQQYDSRTIPFKRGDILDVGGTKLATSERVYNVILDAKVLLSGKEKEVKKAKKETAKALELCFEISKEDVYTALEEKPNSRYIILKKRASYDQQQKFEALKKEDAERKSEDRQYANMKGVWMEEDYVRTYPYGTLAADLIGFTASGNVGNSGLEAYYNDSLNGTDGREYGYLDETSSVEKIVKEAADGKTLVTSIDLNLQTIVEKYIKEFNDAHKDEKDPTSLGSKNTAVMVMRPNTGEILAMASYPSYDLNNPRDLSAYFKEEDLAKMSDEDKVKEMNKLWRNFCVSDTYEPGSTMKPFTVAAGLENGTLKGDEKYYCGGSLHVGDWDISCNNVKGHQTLDLEGAIAHSCNVALMEIGAAIGPQEFSKYQHIFGFGEYSGIDLPGEGSTSGLLFDPEKMGSTDLATNAFGQNFNVTMTQLAAGFCSLINGGNYYEPHVVTQIKDANGNVVENIDPVLVKKPISEETSKKIKEYMYATVESGSGKKAQVEGYDIGGKTGTAEKHPRSEGKNLVSFISYAPQDNPEIMVYVAIDEPNVANQANSGLAVSLSQKIMKEAFPYLNITKVEKK